MLLQVFDFELTEDEMKTISGFNRNWRACPLLEWDFLTTAVSVVALFKRILMC